MERKLIVLIGFALFLGACGLPVGLPKEYRYAGPLSKADLVGLWVLDARSADLLRQQGARLYRRQTDHVIMLNNDGSCVLRGFGIALPPFPSVFAESEEVAYTTPPIIDNPTFPSQYMRWYQWNTNGLPVIAGLFDSPDTVPGVVSLPSHFTSWAIDDWGPRVSRPSHDVIRTRYGVRLMLRVRDGNRHWGSTKDFYVGQDAQGLFLWEMGGGGSFEVPGNTLVYRRMSMEELQRMLQLGQ